MHVKTFYTSVRRIEYTLAETDIRTMALAKARTYVWGPVPEGMREDIEVEINHDEDKAGTTVTVTRVFLPLDEEPESVDAVDPVDGETPA